MMAKHVSLFVAVLVAFGACVAGEAKKGKIVDYEVYVDQIIHQFSKEMEKEYGFRCVGDGGRMTKNVEEISVKFHSYQRVTIEKARILEVNAIKKLLMLINSHEKIRPFLCEYPFKSDRVEVSISFHKADNSYYSDGSVAYVSLIRDKIYYDKAETNPQNLVDLYEEPYETALKIVNESVKKEDPPARK